MIQARLSAGVLMGRAFSGESRRESVTTGVWLAKDFVGAGELPGVRVAVRVADGAA